MSDNTPPASPLAPDNASALAPSATLPPPPDAPVEVRDAWWREHVYRGDKEPQLTWRAVFVGGVIGVLACASALYTSLVIGWAFGVAITACIITHVTFNALRGASGGRIRAMGMLENGAASSIASVTGITPSHTVVGAFGGLILLGGTSAGLVDGVVPWYVMMPTVLFSSLLGTLIAIPLKRRVVNDDPLKFPSSIAFAETMRTLYANGREAVDKARCLCAGMAAGAVLGAGNNITGLTKILRDAFGLVWLDDFATRIALPALVPFEGPLNPLNWWRIHDGRPALYGFEISLLLLGAGMIVGLRVSLSMLGSALLLNCLVLPLLVLQDKANAGMPGWVPNLESKVDAVTGVTTYLTYKWSLWCGTSVMVMSGLTALALQWPVLARAFGSLFRRRKAGADRPADPVADLEVPMRWFAFGIIPSAIGLVITLWHAFGIAPHLSLLAVGLSFLTGLICTRTCGETDVNPIGAMGKVAQLLYSALPGARGHADINLMVGGATATAGGSAADLVCDMKMGHLLGLNPRKQFWTQIIGVVLGTVVVVPVWMLLVPDQAALLKYNPPAASMWKAVSQFLTEANTALPHSTQVSMVVGAVIGVALPLLEKALPRCRHYLPSAMGVGLAMVLPSCIPNSLAFAVGALVAWLWGRLAPSNGEKYCVPLASGFVAGESIIAAFIAIAGTLALKWTDVSAWLGQVF
ncbi:MAG: OPT/YSL family transporter [Puniceicoccales bacterium]|jgi:OPT family oligopeptide transporter|nr:OPT/YSL family transporter [Puniceicoccales bacterium]